jgi:transposase
VFLRSLKLIGTAVPDGLELHLICDNYATRKTPAIKKWLLPRFTCTSPPTSSPRINLVERWFAELTNRKLRRSAPQRHRLEADIRKWINAWYKDPGHTSGPRPPTRSSTPAPPTCR